MHFEMLHPTATSSLSSCLSPSATNDKSKSKTSVHPKDNFSVNFEMAEFQKVVDNYRTTQQICTPISSPPPPPSDTPTSLNPPLLLSDEDGYLHPEVGIDHELERLLAENPGLFMSEAEAEKMTVHVPSPQRR